ncbi:MAG: glycosyltransferase family 4 protein [Prevotella sp.]
MNIFILCPRLCYGGAERVGVVLANGLAEKGHKITMISNLFEPITYSLNSNINLLPLVKTNTNKLKKWSSCISLVRQHIKKEQPDIIIGILHTCSFIAKLASIGLNIPIIATEHDAFERPHSAPFTLGKKFAKFGLNKLYNNITVLTSADKDLIKNKFKNVYVMPNPLAFHAVTAPPKKEHTIIAAGRLEDWHYKGFDILIKAWAKICKDHPTWTLKIAGIGTEQQQEFILNLAKEANIKERIELLGFQEDLKSVFNKAAIFVLSSRYEGFGLVLIEAMSQGCACVAADYNGRQKEIITNNKNGITIEPDNIEELSNALTKLLIDDKFRQEVSEKAIERSHFYDVNHIAGKWEHLLLSIINK